MLSSDKSYDGNPNAQIFGTAVLQNEVSSALGSSTDRSPYSGDDLLINSGSVSAEFNDKNVLLANRVSFSGLALSGTDTGNYKLLLHADVSNVIRPKTVELSANRIYDGTIDLTGNDVTITTGVGSETLNHTGGTSSSKDVAVLNKYIDGITLENATDGSGGLSSNYQKPILNVSNAPVTITKKTVNLSANRIYNGTIDLTGNDVTITTGVGSETLSYSGGTSSSKDVAILYKYIDGITLENAIDGSGGLSSNYQNPSLDAVNAPVTISKKMVNLSASRIYDGTIDLIGTDVTITTGVGSETLSHSGTSASSKDVAVSNKYIDAVTLVDATDGSGGLASNYKLPSLDRINAPAIISAKTVGLSASRIYDGSINLTGGDLTIATGVGSETLSYSGAVASSKDVAVSNKYINAITLVDATDGSGGLESNYKLPSLDAINAPVTISRKAVGLSASKIYDAGVDLTGYITLSTGVGSETLSYSGATASSKDVVVSNKYIDTITLVDATDGTGGLASNYKIPALDESNAPVVITEKVVSLSASKIYDAGVDLAGYVTLITGVGSETLNYSGATASSKDVAVSNKYIDNITLENSLDGSGGVASNYQIPNLDAIKAPVTINEKTVSLSAERIYDGTMDLVGTDVRITTGVGSETLSYRGARSSSKDVAASNKYIDNISLENAIDGSGGSVTNYKLPTLNAGNSPVTINPKTVGLFAERIYDGTIDLTESVVVITTGVGGETLTHIGSTSSSKDVAVANKYINTISLTDAVDGSGGLASNYSLPSLDSINAPVSITEKTVGLSANRIYDASETLTGADIIISTGVKGEKLNFSGATASSKDVAELDKYISAITLEDMSESSGGLASNYIIPVLNKLTAPVTIQPASLYVKAKDEIKTYGREAILDEEAFEVNGLQGGEGIFFVSMFSEGRNENAGLGTYDIVPNLARGPNFIPSNYSITYNPGTLIIEASPFEQKTALVTVELAQNNVVSVDPSLTTNVSSTPFTPEDIVPEVPPLINSPLPVTSTPTAEPTVVESTPTPTPTSSPTPTAPEPSPEPVTETVSTPPEPVTSPAPVASPTDTGSSNNVPGLTVDLLDTPDSSTIGLIAVSVPKTTTTKGAGFSFELPTEISSITKKTDVSVEVTMESGAPLPSWLSYQQDSGKFSSASVPEGAFPVTVIMKIGDQQVAVVISERQD